MLGLTPLAMERASAVRPKKCSSRCGSTEFGPAVIYDEGVYWECKKCGGAHVWGSEEVNRAWRKSHPAVPKNGIPAIESALDRAWLETKSVDLITEIDYPITRITIAGWHGGTLATGTADNFQSVGYVIHELLNTVE